MAIAIKMDNVSHKFKEQVVFDNVSIDFYENKIYGILGKNGVGKTTLLNIITNQLISKNGSIKIFEKEVSKHPNVLDNACIVKEREFSDNEYKVKNILDMYSCFYDNYDTKLENELCKKFNINTKKRYKSMSRGNKSMISNIIGICSNAPITIFDEPTLGLDAVNREEFYSLLLESYVNNPRTIIIATHLINEVENLLENVVVIDKQNIIINDEIENVLQKSYYISGQKYDLKNIECIKGSKSIKSFGNKEIYFYYGDISESDLNLIDSLNISLENTSLQELFINITKEGIN